MHDDPVMIVRGLLGAADVAGGPTTEQFRVIQSLASGYLGLDGAILDLGSCTPAELAATVDESGRHRVVDLLILVEFCRHPSHPAQADQVEAYVDALGGEDLALVARDIQTGHRDQVMADWARFGEAPTRIHGVSDDALGSELRSLGDCAPGTLGRGLFDFYADLGLPFPGEPGGGDTTLAYHDVTHILTGYGTTPPDEVALQAVLTAAAGFDHHFSGLVASLALFESAAFELPGFTAKEGVLNRPGAADELADAFRRGEACTGDISTVDFLARKDDLLADIQAEYGLVPPPKA
jgi:hypothetical protein